MTRIPLRVRLGYGLRRYFVAGLAALFPLVVTVQVIVWIFRTADRTLGRWLGFTHPGLGLLVTAGIVLAVGVFSIHFFGRVVFRTIEVWFTRLPVVGKIYPAVSQLARFLFSDGERKSAFRRVVLVEYPRSGVYSLAFVTGEEATEATGVPRRMLTLLIPQPPSPVTGPVIFVPAEDVRPLDMSVEDAVKLIMSGGVVAAPLRAGKPLTR